MPQLLEYFKENAKDIPYSLLSEALINNKNYEKEVKEMIEKSNKVSEKYIEKNKIIQVVENVIKKYNKQEDEKLEGINENTSSNIIMFPALCK